MHQLNEDIRDSEIRLIGSTGEQLGIMSAAQAQRIADEQGLDLVKISPQATPPVCKLMDYGKFRFEQGKREKEAKKNQHVEFRSDENPVTNLLAGHLTVHTYLAPYIPAEYIENIREYDVDALESAIGGE